MAALVSDISGTTTDVALLKIGRPAIDPMGIGRSLPYHDRSSGDAYHGPWWESEVHFQVGGLDGAFFPGIMRVLPVSLGAIEQPQIVHDALDAQLKSSLPVEYDGRFVKKTNLKDPKDFADRDRRFWIKLTDSFNPWGKCLVTDWKRRHCFGLSVVGLHKSRHSRLRMPVIYSVARISKTKVRQKRLCRCMDVDARVRGATGRGYSRSCLKHC